ncbi:Dihydrofolate reductase [Amycolatopsis xylanica]|uniref:Dihydrofolate reductase n=1 Tax=Amycolatopsis xylanica TaxID=589385 RepID=A0A1H2ZI26_9PSEU|nr:dihydrofolate reductase family protein [Amycolatopsis xylanica]SDX16414.1 Dihydrofolate reductase [Amycolatopsis xylanica]
MAVFVDLSISLDGYIGGPNGGPANPLGDGGTRLHEWVFGQEAWRASQGLPGGETGPDNDVIKEVRARAGANVMGRRMFDEGEPNWPAEAPFHAPVFVLTHSPRDPWPRLGGTTFHFVTGSVEDAIEQAKAAAGGRDVQVNGGADMVRQALRAGLVDDLQLHVAPITLGRGTRLFDGMDDLRLVPDRVIASAGVTHLRYRVRSTS